MSELKVRLNLVVPGANMLSRKECLENPENSYNSHKINLSYMEKKGRTKKLVKEILVVRTRKARTATQNIGLCQEAYEYMLNTPPSEKLLKKWATMSKKERLAAHFTLIANDFNAISFSYEVLDD
jgi:hypothetical protein